jgi:hypothetical protein
MLQSIVDRKGEIDSLKGRDDLWLDLLLAFFVAMFCRTEQSDQREAASPVRTIPPQPFPPTAEGLRENERDPTTPEKKRAMFTTVDKLDAIGEMSKKLGLQGTHKVLGSATKIGNQTNQRLRSQKEKEQSANSCTLADFSRMLMTFGDLLTYEARNEAPGEINEDHIRKPHIIAVMKAYRERNEKVQAHYRAKYPEEYVDDAQPRRNTIRKLLSLEEDGCCKRRKNNLQPQRKPSSKRRKPNHNAFLESAGQDALTATQDAQLYAEAGNAICLADEVINMLHHRARDLPGRKPESNDLPTWEGRAPQDLIDSLKRMEIMVSSNANTTKKMVSDLRLASAKERSKMDWHSIKLILRDVSVQMIVM